MKLLLAPHFDDETLFAAYICLRERPLIVFCFDGAPRHGSFSVRQREAREATAFLGCHSIALREDPETLAEHLSTFDPEHVWAPLPEDGGNSDHNLVGEIAERLWPGRVSFYTTYTTDGRTTTGLAVDVAPGWLRRKQAALLCYRSQSAHPHTRAHFERALDEYEIVLGEVLA